MCIRDSITYQYEEAGVDPDDSRASVAEPRSLDRVASSRDKRTATPRGRSVTEQDGRPEQDEELDADRRASA